MRFLTYSTNAGRDAAPGILLDDLETIVDLGRHYATLQELIEAGDEGRARAEYAATSETTRLSLNDVQLLAPLPRPRQMRDCMVYEEHIRQAIDEGHRRNGGHGTPPPIPPIWYRQPIYYKCNRLSVIGTGTDVLWPSYSEFMDFELEIAVVIGRKVRDLTIDDAAGAIFGYMIFNDMTARDAQIAEMSGGLGPAKGKDFDTGNVLGPWITTADTIPDIRQLRVKALVNGEVVAETNAAGMQHDVAQVLAHISAGETLYPGEVIALGTIGNCCLVEHGRALNPGDLIELEVEKLGTLRNRLVRERQ